MPFEDFVCLRCGRCCTDVPGANRNTVDAADLARWRARGRDDILAWIKQVDIGDGRTRPELWFDPQTGLAVRECPWVERNADGTVSCRIQDDKPRHCRDWPPTRQDAANYLCPCGGDLEPGGSG